VFASLIMDFIMQPHDCERLLLMDRVVDFAGTSPRKSWFALWILPWSRVPGNTVAMGGRSAWTVTVLQCTDDMLRLRMQQLRSGWEFTTVALQLGSRVVLPDGLVVCFGFGPPQRTVSFELEQCPSVPPEDRSDMCGTCSPRTLLVCHRTLAVALKLQEVKQEHKLQEHGHETSAWLPSGWLPTPEPLSRIAYCASQACYFGLGARDPRQVWKFGLAGDLVCSVFLCGLPSGTPCMLLVTRTYVHVRAESGQWQDLTFDLKTFKSSGGGTGGGTEGTDGTGHGTGPTLAVFESDDVRYDGWTAVVPFGTTREAWPLNLLQVPGLKVQCAVKTGSGLLVMASAKQIVRARPTRTQDESTQYEPMGEPYMLPPGQQVRAMVCLGSVLWKLDTLGSISRVEYQD
jgi:hypothetical protein